MSQANKNLVGRFINEVINGKQLDLIDELVHPDYVFRTADEELRGRQELREFFSAYHGAFPDLKVTIDDLVSADNRTVLRFTLSATHEREFMGIAATGKRVDVHGMIWSRIDNGQIVEEWELLDQLTMFRQLGLVSI